MDVFKAMMEMDKVGGLPKCRDESHKKNGDKKMVAAYRAYISALARGNFLA